MAHAQLSPSSAARWLTCQASVIMQEGMPDTQNQYAAEGTAAHHLAERCLMTAVDAGQYAGDEISVRRRGECHFHSEMVDGTYDDIEFTFSIDAEMVEYVNEYLSLVRSMVDATGGELLVEQRLPLTEITGEDGAKGTSDAVILADDEIIVIDLKYGQGAKTEAEENPQLMIYGLSALLEYDMIGDFQDVRLIICQPRRQHVAEWVISADDLREFGANTRAVADNIATMDGSTDLREFMQPSAEACKYCKARFECKALADKVTADIIDNFDDLDAAQNKDAMVFDEKRLVELYDNIALYQLFTKTLEEAMFEKLQAGAELPGYKLVQGRGGRRKWRDEEEAEEALKRMRVKVDNRYKRVLVSPTDAERLYKAGDIGEKQWNALQEYINKAEGKATIASATDKRNAIIPTVDMFDKL